jgi:hypothetical protein
MDGIDGGLIYPTISNRPPANNGGAWYRLGNQWKYVYNGYLDRFFCQKNIKNIDFTMVWYHYQFGYPTGIRTLVSDNINNNYIKYDYNNFELLVYFNGKSFKKKMIFPEFMWYQTYVKFIKEEGILYFGYRDFFHEHVEEFQFNVGIDLEFELMSLWARYLNDEGRYVEIQRGVMGLLLIKEGIFDNIKLYNYFKNHKQFLIQFKMDIPKGDL